MVYFTGDIHGAVDGIAAFINKVHPVPEDVIILLGDVDANYYKGRKDDLLKRFLNDAGSVFLCIHGNHEMRPASIPGYIEREWNGGIVWVQPEYPSLLFAIDGEIYTLGGIRYLVIGGAYSVGKYYRLVRGWGWWPDEQPSDEIKAYVERQIRENDIDIVLSHTGPFKYEPTEMFLGGLDQSTVDDSTERWLYKIEETIEYKAWFCGHWHTDKRIDKMHFIFKTFESDEQFRSEKEIPKYKAGVYSSHILAGLPCSKV